MIMSFQRFTYTIAVLLLLASSEARNIMASGQKAPTEGTHTRLVILSTRSLDTEGARPRVLRSFMYVHV